jgi:hypothetical protein
MPRKHGLRDDDMLGRLDDIERRLDAMDADAGQPAGKPRKPRDEKPMPADTVEGSRQLDRPDKPLHDEPKGAAQVGDSSKKD